jgi:hypothetical protein
MPIDAICPGCQAKLRIGDEFAGQQARCPRCDAIYAVPEAMPEAVVEANVEATAPTLAAATAEPEPPAPATETATAMQAKLPPPDGTRWFLRTPEGPIYGPTDAATFQRWVTDGRVTPDCFVCPGDNVWVPATQTYPELAAPRPKAVVKLETSHALKHQPHRGALILLLGIMGVLTTCPIPSIMAWVMGSHDLGEMQAARMDPSGERMTNAGRLLGLIFSMVYIVAAVIGMFALVMVAARA